MCFAPQRHALFRHHNFQKSSDTEFCTFWLGNVLRATTACTFSTSQLPKVVRRWGVLYLFTSKSASRHNGVHFFDIWTSKTAPNPSIFNTFYFQMCFAPQHRALFQHLNFQKWSDAEVFCTFSLRNRLRATTACTFSTSELPKVVRRWGALYILTSKCASRHNGVHFFDIWTSKTAPNPSIFNTFYFQMCFAPQHRALFQHLNFQKWSDTEVFCTFSLRNLLRATTACNFSSLISPDFSAPAALASLLFNPPEPQNHEKNTVFRDFPIFLRTCIFFLLIFSLLTLLPADCFFISPYWS